MAAAIAAQKAAASRNRCGGYSSRYRSESYSNALSRVAQTVTPEKGWYVSVQPSVGFAYLPTTRSTVTTESMNSKTGINYIAGNMNSAFVAGTGFEFGENDSKKFNVSVQYIKGIGNLDNRNVSTISGSKTTTTMLGSSVSGINVSLGIPINFSKKKAVVQPIRVIEQKKIIQKKTTQPRSRCMYSRMMQSI